MGFYCWACKSSRTQRIHPPQLGPREHCHDLRSAGCWPSLRHSHPPSPLHLFCTKTTLRSSLLETSLLESGVPNIHLHRRGQALAAAQATQPCPHCSVVLRSRVLLHPVSPSGAFDSPVPRPDTGVSCPCRNLGIGNSKRDSGLGVWAKSWHETVGEAHIWAH